jgi:hypothetical protein
MSVITGLIVVLFASTLAIWVNDHTTLAGDAITDELLD